MTKCNVRYFDFYPRPPRGGRPLILFFRFPNTGISIHALREEGDHPAPAQNTGRCNFYPRPPRGGRLTMFASSMPSILNFYPRPPRGGRPAMAARCSPTPPFLSTPSARRATTERFRAAIPAQISIHALREEGDNATRDIVDNQNQFLSTPSARRATRRGKSPGVFSIFLSTPSARRATKDVLDFLLSLAFLSTPSARRATLAI